jgi:hypothetical protein
MTALPALPHRFGCLLSCAVHLLPPTRVRSFGAKQLCSLPFFLDVSPPSSAIPLNGLVRPSSSKHQMHDLRCLGKRGVPATGSCSCRTDQVWWCHCCRRGERRGGRGRWGWRILVLGFLGVSPSIQSSSLSSDGSTDGEGSGTTKISLGSSSPSSSPS